MANISENDQARISEIEALIEREIRLVDFGYDVLLNQNAPSLALSDEGRVLSLNLFDQGLDHFPKAILGLDRLRRLSVAGNRPKSRLDFLKTVLRFLRNSQK